MLRWLSGGRPIGNNVHCKRSFIPLYNPVAKGLLSDVFWTRPLSVPLCLPVATFLVLLSCDIRIQTCLLLLHFNTIRRTNSARLALQYAKNIDSEKKKDGRTPGKMERACHYDKAMRARREADRPPQEARPARGAG